MDISVPRDVIANCDSYELLCYIALKVFLAGRLYKVNLVRISNLAETLYLGEETPAYRMKCMRDALKSLCEKGYVVGELDAKDTYLIDKDELFAASKSFISLRENELRTLLPRTYRKEVLSSLKTYCVILSNIYGKTRVAEITLGILSDRTGVKPKALISHIKLLEDLRLLAVGRFINNHKMGNVYARYVDKEYVEKWIGSHNTAVR